MTIPAPSVLRHLQSLLLATAVGVVWTARASGEPDARDPVAAEVVFERALAALKADNWEAACPDFEKSMALDPSASTMAKIARCHEHEGRLATAWYDYQQALKLVVEGDYGERRRADLAAFIRQAADELEPRVPRLLVAIEPEPPELVIERDGQPVPTATVGEEVFVDPGRHEIVARAPGYEPARVEITAVAGQTARAELKLTASTPSERAPEAVASAPAPPPPPIELEGPPVTHATTSEPPTWSQRHTAGVLAGAGVVSGAVASYLGLRTLNKLEQADANCNENWECEGDGLARLSEARRSQTAGIAMASVGGVLLGTGAALWFSHRRSRSGQTVRAVSFTAEPASAMLSIRGTW